MSPYVCPFNVTFNKLQRSLYTYLCGMLLYNYMYVCCVLLIQLCQSSVESVVHMSIVSPSTHTPCGHCWTHVVIRIGQVHLYTYHVSKSLDMSTYELTLSHTVFTKSHVHVLSCGVFDVVT